MKKSFLRLIALPVLLTFLLNTTLDSGTPAFAQVAVSTFSPLKSGDNFISPAVKSATDISTVLSGLTLGIHYSDVKRYNPTTQGWESYIAGQFTQFEPGKGYNILGLTNTSFSYGKTETVSTFVYDSTGSRVKKTEGSTTTIYLGKDYDITGSLSTKYIFLGDRRISTKKSDGSLEYIHSDHINSSNIITDSNGNQSGLLEYDPYGSTVTQTGTSDPKHKFTGQEEDDSTRLYYYGARYMDPQLGRFITADWIVKDPGNPQDLNRYTYARNNPLVYTDPTGNFVLLAALAFIAASAAIGAAINVAVQAAFGNIHSFGDIGKAALVGAVAGAATGAGALALGAIGITGGLLLTLGETMVGAGAGYLSGGVNNSLEGRGFNENALLNAGAGAASVVGAKVLGPAFQKAGEAISKFPIMKPAISMIESISQKIPFADRLNSIGQKFDNWYSDLYDTAINRIQVRHYTNQEGYKGIFESGVLKKDTYMTKPFSASKGEVERLLEIEQGRGEFYFDLVVKPGDLVVPKNGPVTSGGQFQRQLSREIKIDPKRFKKT